MVINPTKKCGLINQMLVSASLTALFFFGIFIPKSFAAFGDCPTGYEFQRMSGVGCVQKNCAAITSAHYSYEGYCICGSAGSINENPNDPNKRCTLSHDNAPCPDCVYACVHNNEPCPGEKPAAQPPPQPATEPAPANQNSNEILPIAPTPPETKIIPGRNTNPNEEPKLTKEQERIIKILNEQLAPDNLNKTRVVTAGISWEGIKNVTQRGFGVMMEVLGWGLDKTIGWKIIQDKENTDSGWAGLLVGSDGDYVDVKVFEGRLELSWENGVAAEFNLISVKGRPGSHSFIDGFSIGVGPGAVNKNEGDHEIPGTPISPNINFDNIRNYFDEKWENTKSWWQENVPWPLGGANNPNIGGGQ